MSNNKYGSFKIIPEGKFQAGSYTTIKFRYIAGSAGVKIGGKLKIALPNMGWSEPLTPYPRACPDMFKGNQRIICNWKRCNTTYKIKSKNRADIYLSSRESQNRIGKYKNWSWWITAEVELKPLIKNDGIIIIYGDKSFGEQGALVQPWAEKSGLWFTCLVDIDGSGKFNEVYGSPVECSVGPGQFDHCIFTAPSIIRPKEKVSLKAALVDKGQESIEIAPEMKSEIRRYHLKPVFKNHFEKIEGCRIKNNGKLTLDIKFKDGKTITTESNPVIIKKDGLRLFWGDLHAHSYYHQYEKEAGRGEGCLKPDELLKYARETAHLDFVALADGKGALPSNEGWREAQQALIDNYRENEFVTLKGWEIQMGKDGHRNAIYREANIEPHITAPQFRETSIWGTKNREGMEGVLAYYRNRKDVILIPHHTLSWMNWDIYDSGLDRLVEIYSCWGSSESPYNELWNKSSPPGQSVTEALDRGYRLGFVAGSDTHAGFPGRSIPDAEKFGFLKYKSGYTGVYSEKLTRQSVFDALRARRCYATTGTRMIVGFSVDGKIMGEVLTVNSAKKHKIYISVVGTDIINKMEIIRDGNVIKTIKPYKEKFEDVLTDKSNAKYYYLRISQVDGNWAWISPVWLIKRKEK